MYPPQPPHDPYAAGAYAYQPGPPAPTGMPGTAIAVRVLKFIGGVCGVLFGALFWFFAVMATGEGQFSQDFLDGMGDAGLPLSGGEAGLYFGIMGAIPFIYGVLSIVLASLMGRRSAGVMWSVVVFQGLAALLLVLAVVMGGFASIIPLIFTIGMIVLMVVPNTRAYYENKPAGPGYPAAPGPPGAY